MHLVCPDCSSNRNDCDAGDKIPNTRTTIKTDRRIIVNDSTSTDVQTKREILCFAKRNRFGLGESLAARM